MTEKKIRIVADTEITKQMKKYGLVDPRSAVLLPMLSRIASAETAGRGAVKAIVEYLALGSQGVYRQGKTYNKGERIPSEVLQDGVTAIYKAALLTTLKRGAFYALEECGVETREETINKKRFRKVVNIRPVDSKKIEEMKEFFADSHQQLDKYFPDSAKEQKKQEKEDKINAGAFTQIEKQLENQVKRAKEWIENNKANKKANEKEMQYYMGLRDMCNDCLSLLRTRKTSGAYDKYM
jgi:hypothetical protein